MRDFGVIPICQLKKAEFIRSFPSVFSATPNSRNVIGPFNAVPARPVDDPIPAPEPGRISARDTEPATGGTIHGPLA